MVREWQLLRLRSRERTSSKRLRFCCSTMPVRRTLNVGFLQKLLLGVSHEKVGKVPKAGRSIRPDSWMNEGRVSTTSVGLANDRD